MISAKCENDCVRLLEVKVLEFGRETTCEMRYSIEGPRGHSPLSSGGCDCLSGNGPEIALFEYPEPEMPTRTLYSIYS